MSLFADASGPLAAVPRRQDGLGRGVPAEPELVRDVVRGRPALVVEEGEPFLRRRPRVASASPGCGSRLASLGLAARAASGRLALRSLAGSLPVRRPARVVVLAGRQVVLGAIVEHLE